MNFISLTFFCFFTIFAVLFFLAPLKLRPLLIFIAGIIFYGHWKLWHLSILLLTVVVDFTAGRKIYSAPTKRQKRFFLCLSLCTNLGILVVFKYYNFFAANYMRVTHQQASLVALALPIGISFFTFQSMAYTIDIYRDKLRPERRFLYFGAFVTFFPQLVAGPIQRAKDFIPQFYQDHRWDYQRAVSGLQRTLFGVFKKVVVADNLSDFVSGIFASPQIFSGPTLLLGSIMFTIQIYCDFSGYTDIAIGISRILGFELNPNFRQPLFADSLTNFWSRWHISLSTWFRDYLYIPLGGNRETKYRNIFNLMITFLLSGFWHGAAWTFIVWGFFHGFFVSLEKFWPPWTRLMNGAPRIMRQFITFMLVVVGFVYFRANGLGTANYILAHYWKLGGKVFTPSPKLSNVYTAMLLLFILDLIDSKKGFERFLQEEPWIFRWTCYFLFLFVIVAWGEFGDQPFIYFQF